MANKNTPAKATENKTQKETAQASDNGVGAVNETSAKAKEAEAVNPTVLRQLKAKALRAKKAKKYAAEKKKKAAKDAQKKSASESRKKAGDRPVYTDERGLKFRFKATAPDAVNIDGKSTKISEIIKDEEIMSELIYGNSNYIEQIF